MSKEHQFEKLRNRIKMNRIGEACMVKANDVKGICPPNYEKTDSRPLISPRIMDVKCGAPPHDPASPVRAYFVMVYNEVEEGGGVTMHEHEAEHGYFIIAGKMLLRIGKEENELGAGTALYIPSGVPHSFKAVGRDKLRLIMIYSPPYKNKGVPK
ncbi:MAG: cupin domain-containing protein [archaeon]|nr:cupin domain-containing protein [archaeon]